MSMSIISSVVAVIVVAKDQINLQNEDVTDVELYYTSSVRRKNWCTHMQPSVVCLNEVSTNRNGAYLQLVFSAITSQVTTDAL